MYWRGTTETAFNVIETEVTTHTLENLTPNSPYIIYVTAVSKAGESLPSETLMAWTDPAFPAFVEVSNQYDNSIIILTVNFCMIMI